MSTEKQIEANRRNAEKSTGPRTPDGKARASQNSLKHGLTAEQVVLPSEDTEVFDHHAESLRRHLDPQGPL